MFQEEEGPLVVVQPRQVEATRRIVRAVAFFIT